MEDEPDRVPPPTAEQEAERRREVLAERHRLRTRRRVITGAAVLAATVLVGAGAVTAWNSQAHAELAAAGIEQWRDDRDAAECRLTARVHVAVRAEERARALLADARAIPAAEGVYGEAERAAFGDDGIPLLQAMAQGTILDDVDRARAAEEAGTFDTETCVTEARQARAPLGPATAENADELAREWRALGAADDVDDSRVVAFEAAVEELGELAESTATSRADIETLRSAYQAAPAEAFDRFDEIDAAMAALTEREPRDAANVFDLVRVLADRAAGAREVEALALTAAAEAEATAAAAAAEAQAAAEAAAAEAAAAAAAQQTEPPAVIRPAPNRPRPVQPPPQVPAQPTPSPSVEPVPVDPVPVDPQPTIPLPPEVTDPSEPAPIIPIEPVLPGDDAP